MFRRITALAHCCPAAERGAASPLALPLLATGVVLVAAGVGMANPVEMLIGVCCAVAALSLPAANG